MTDLRERGVIRTTLNKLPDYRLDHFGCLMPGIITTREAPKFTVTE